MDKISMFLTKSRNFFGGVKPLENIGFYFLAYVFWRLGFIPLIGGLPVESEQVSDLQRVMEAGYRATDIVKQILTFSRQADQELKPFRLQLVIKEALNLLRSSIPTTIAIKQNINSDCEPILSDPTQIHQIIRNTLFCNKTYR